MREFIAASAAGYVLQSRAMTDLNPVIEHVLVGNGYILPDVSAYDLLPKHRKFQGLVIFRVVVCPY